MGHRTAWEPGIVREPISQGPLWLCQPEGSQPCAKSPCSLPCRCSGILHSPHRSRPAGSRHTCLLACPCPGRHQSPPSPECHQHLPGNPSSAATAEPASATVYVGHRAFLLKGLPAPIQPQVGRTGWFRGVGNGTQGLSPPGVNSDHAAPGQQRNAKPLPCNDGLLSSCHGRGNSGWSKCN